MSVDTKVRESIDQLDTIAESLKTIDETVKQGSAMADGLSAIMAMLDDDLQEKAREALARWYEAAPKVKSRSASGEHAAKDLGFTVVITDQKTRKVVASTRKDNLNSVRYQVLKHNETEHGNKWERSSDSYKGLTDALTKVMAGEAESVEGAGYTVSKSVAS